MVYVTTKQKTAFNNMVGNGGNVTKAMIDAKYAIATANTPQKLTESKGFQVLLKESGLTNELVAKSLVRDIKKKPQNRLGELRLGADILGMTKPEFEKNNTNIYINIINYGNNSTI